MGQSMKKHRYTWLPAPFAERADSDLLASWPLELERHPVLTYHLHSCNVCGPTSSTMPATAHRLQHRPPCSHCTWVPTACWRGAAGLFPNSWPLPLTNSGLAQVRGNAARQPGARATAAPGPQLRQPVQQQQSVEPAPARPVADTVQVSGLQRSAAKCGSAQEASSSV